MPALLESIRGRDSCYKTALRCIETLVDSDRGARMVAMEMQGDLAVLSVLAPLLHGDAPDPSACRIFQILLMRYEDCRADIPPEIIAAVDAFCRETDLAAEIVNRPISAGAGVTAALPTALERVPSSTASDDVRSQSPDPSPSPDSTTALPESRSFASSAGGPADFTGQCCIVTVFLPGGARSQVAATHTPIPSSGARLRAPGGINMPGGIRDWRARQRGVGTCRAMLRLDCVARRSK